MQRTDLYKQPFWLAVISTKRPAAPQAYRDMVGTATWYVGPGETQAYLANGAERCVEVVGLCAARNQALEDGFARGLPVIQMSDDLRSIIRAELTPESTPQAPRAVRVEATMRELVTDVLGSLEASPRARLAGLNATNSLIFAAGMLQAGNRIGRRTFILGDFLAVQPTHLRFDVALNFKEDYDYTIQHLDEYGEVCRCQQWLVDYRHWTNAGGAVDRRTVAREQETIAKLRDKWGTDMFTTNPARPTDVLLNYPTRGKSKRALNVKQPSIFDDADLPPVVAHVTPPYLVKQPKPATVAAPTRVQYTWPNGHIAQPEQGVVRNSVERYVLCQVTIEGGVTFGHCVPEAERENIDVEWLKFPIQELEPALQEVGTA